MQPTVLRPQATQHRTLAGGISHADRVTLREEWPDKAMLTSSRKPVPAQEKKTIRCVNQRRGDFSPPCLLFSSFKDDEGLLFPQCKFYTLLEEMQKRQQATVPSLSAAAHGPPWCLAHKLLLPLFLCLEPSFLHPLPDWCHFQPEFKFQLRRAAFSDPQNSP